MATAKRSSKTRRPPAKANEGAASALSRPFGEFLGVALLAVGVLMLGGLLSYQGGSGTLMGPVGHLVAAATYASFGMAAYLITLGVFGIGVKALLGRGMEISLGEGIGFSVATVAGCVLLHVMFSDYRVHGYTAGGLTGELVGEVCVGLFHYAGTYLVACALLCVGLLASTPLSADHLVRGGAWVSSGAAFVGRYLWTGVVDLVRTQGDAGVVDASDDCDDDEMLRDPEENEGWVEYDEQELELEAPADPEPLVAAGKGDNKISASKSPKNRRRTPKLKAGQGEPDPEHEDGPGAADDDAQDVEVVGPTAKAATKGKTTKGKTAKGKTNKGAKAAELDEPDDAPMPEIVVRVENGEAPVANTAANGKKAPPRPEELAQRPIGDFKAATKPAAAKKTESGGSIAGVVRLTSGPFELPPLELFATAEAVVTEFDRDFVLDQARKLVAALSDFRIRGKVTKIHPGPVITRYEFKPEAGVKLSKIESLENDLAMALEAIRIRILAPIPGKSAVGFEVPNKTRETVYIKEILEQENFGAKQKLPLALGKDITGTIITTDLAKAPHLLVAGATGSGKSVGVNSMICSLLYTSTPEQVRMIMIDPKMLELSIYEGIPHLMLPVVTDPEKASMALRWAVQEMERRYALLSENQVRDISGFNKKLPAIQAAWDKEKRLTEVAAAEVARDAALEGEDGAQGSALAGMTIDAAGNPVEVIGGAPLPERPVAMPYIVVIIDEFADLMMVASKEVEQSVARIAAKARAAGIHLIVATQRPSVDVITGTIKNNFPSRVAFQVTSEVDSRTILDGKGAKQLLGMGDMLHMDRGVQPNRVHGCFVSEEEILKVVDFVKRQARPVYNMDIVRVQEDAAGPDDENLDPFYDRAVEVVAEAQKVSTSMIQRRLGVGYNRAAKIVDAMEERGVIGPSRGTTPREVYVSAA